MSPIGEHLGEFEILELLGKGGMGAVYKARQTSLNRFVALKTLQPGLAVDERYVMRFLQEARAAASLNHPNLVQVYSAGENEGLHWFAMEYVEGESARQRLKRKGMLDPREAIAIAIRVTTALDYGWSKASLIHRDIKPDNIFLSDGGEVKLGDLGLAKTAEQSPGLTGTGASLGTPNYMSPEQVEGKDVDLRSDIYSLGCTLYHLLSGRPPFEANNAAAVMLKHLNTSPSDLRDALPTCPAELAATIKKMMQKEPAERQQTYGDVSTGLLRAYQILCGESIPDVVAVTRKQAIQRKVAAWATGHAVRVVVWVGGAIAICAVIGALFYFAPWKRGGATDGPSALHGEHTTPIVTAATAQTPFVNSLGQEFVPVAITGGPTDSAKSGVEVLFAVTDTTVSQYGKFVQAKGLSWEKPPFPQGPDHPAVNVSWDDATAFCEWLTSEDRKSGKLSAGASYRLPSDHEWSCAVGIGARELAEAAQKDKSDKIAVYPWGSQWPPPKGAGNYSDSALRNADSQLEIEAKSRAALPRADSRTAFLNGYDDGYAFTSPVKAFPPNAFALYDMGGNVWQWCLDRFDPADQTGTAPRVLRGASWINGAEPRLRSANRYAYSPTIHSDTFGFRCVCVVGSGG